MAIYWLKNLQKFGKVDYSLQKCKLHLIFLIACPLKTEIVNQIIEQINEVLEDPVEEKDSTDGLGDTIKEIF